MKDFLAKNKTIKKLSIQQNRIGINVDNLKLLVEGLNANKTIETLNFSENMLSGERSSVFQNYLSSTSKLRELIYENNMIAKVEKSVEIFMKGLESNKSLRTLKLGRNFLSDSSNNFTYIGKALKSCTTIVNLILNNYPINVTSCFSFEEFSTGLAVCQNIEQLNFSQYKLGGIAQRAKLLAVALKSLKGLKCLI